MLAGACLGFLPHNFNPARIFMGDSGSMLIGLMLAAATTSASGKINQASGSAADLLGLLSPLIVVAAVLFVPLLDLLMAIIRRTRRGESPFSPDKMHLHHRLLEIGHSQRRAVLLIYLWAGCSGVRCGRAHAVRPDHRGHVLRHRADRDVRGLGDPSAQGRPQQVLTRQVRSGSPRTGGRAA